VRGDRLAAIEMAHRRYGARLLAVTRPLPIIAEAYVLLVGAHRYPAAPFITVVAISNFVIAVLFVLLGLWSAAGGWSAAALVISVVVPLLLTLVLERSGAWRGSFRVR
jgi:membrane protein DedA with SNARE-associated domain